MTLSNETPCTSQAELFFEPVVDLYLAMFQRRLAALGSGGAAERTQLAAAVLDFFCRIVARFAEYKRGLGAWQAVLTGLLPPAGAAGEDEFCRWVLGVWSTEVAVLWRDMFASPGPDAGHLACFHAFLVAVEARLDPEGAAAFASLEAAPGETVHEALHDKIGVHPVYGAVATHCTAAVLRAVDAVRASGQKVGGPAVEAQLAAQPPEAVDWAAESANEAKQGIGVHNLLGEDITLYWCNQPGMPRSMYKFWARVAPGGKVNFWGAPNNCYIVSKGGRDVGQYTASLWRAQHLLVLKGSAQDFAEAAARAAPEAPAEASPGRHRHSTPSLTAVGCHPGGIHTVALLSLLSLSAEMTDLPVATAGRRRGAGGGRPRHGGEHAARGGLRVPEAAGRQGGARDKSDCRFRKTATEYDREPGITW
jgi:hypothetical protein